jgi:hypothetical protein
MTDEAYKVRFRVDRGYGNRHKSVVGDGGIGTSSLPPVGVPLALSLATILRRVSQPAHGLHSLTGVRAVCDSERMLA